MKKFYYLVLTVGLCLTACNKVEKIDIDQPQGDKITQTVKVSVADFNGPRTKVTVSTAGEFSWSAGDQLGVFPLQSTLDADGQTSQQILFKLNSDTPATTATFTGTGWGLVTGSTYKYFAYYPYNKDTQHGEATVAYTDNLNQVANHSTSHLGINDFLYAPCIEPATIDEAEFQFKHISALVDFTIAVPVVARGKTFTKVVLSAATPIFTQEGTYNPSTATADEAPEIITTVATDKLNLSLNGGVGFVDDNCIIDVWFLMAPTAFDNTAITVGIYTNDGNYYEGSKNIANPLNSQDFVNYAVDVNPAVIGGFDLSANGTANCYQVRQANTMYSFIAGVKGNGYDPLDEVNHNADAAIDLSYATGAVVLWETVNTKVAPANGTVIKSASLVGNRICITTADEFTPGNALVSLYKDGEGGTPNQYDAEYDEILWSWHIWATNVDFDETVQNLAGVSMMDRNLGALSASREEAGLTVGFHYQWGRPFPILGGCASNDVSVISGSMMGTSCAGGAEWRLTDNAVESNQTTGTLAYSAQHPMTFISSNVSEGGSGHWFHDSSLALWGETKTMYDPCPVGWKVPGKRGSNYTVWSGVFDGNTTTHITGVGRYLNDSNPEIFYPSTGYREFYNGKVVLRNIPIGHYWSVTPSTTAGRACMLSFETSALYASASGYPYSSAAVRPCKDVPAE